MTRELRPSCSESEKRDQVNLHNRILTIKIMLIKIILYLIIRQDKFIFYSFYYTVLVVIQSFSDAMNIDGLIVYVMICLFMISIFHKSFANEEYEPDAKNSKITIELNVNININGSKTKEKHSGNLFFTILYIDNVVIYHVE